ncbi:MAG TPA: hypothetical protein VKE94_23550 [Gemmataceae bacterium]|nr:hypothetical protein [Gemmataceae bacterium]
MSSRFRPGDVVVYRKQKSSLHPGRHARDIQPAPHGDFYSYSVEKFWRVVALQDDKLLVRTRRGKQHTIPANDSNLRRTTRTGSWVLFRSDHKFFVKRGPIEGMTAFVVPKQVVLLRSLLERLDYQDRASSSSVSMTA